MLIQFTEYEGQFTGPQLTKPTIATSPLPLDHQQTVFESGHKTLSWTNTQNGCSGYHLNSTTCNGTFRDQYIIEGTTVAISTLENSGYFTLTEVYGDTGAPCQKFIPDVMIEKNGKLS